MNKFRRKTQRQPWVNAGQLHQDPAEQRAPAAVETPTTPPR